MYYRVYDRAWHRVYRVYGEGSGIMIFMGTIMKLSSDVGVRAMWLTARPKFLTSEQLSMISFVTR